MPARTKDTEPTLADLVAAGDVAGVEKLVENAAAGFGDQELVERIQDLEARLEAEREERRRLNPLADWPVTTTAEELIAHLGDDALLKIALQETAAENRERMKRGYGTLYHSDTEHEEAAQARIPKIAATMATELGKWVPVDPEGFARAQPRRMRTFKMIAPTRGCDRHDAAPVNVCYEHGSMRQIPIELQINNGAASLNDPIERYARKGFKPADPVRCKLLDCYRPAAVAAGGGWRYGMYCSHLHYDFVEGSKTTSKAGNQVDLHSMTL